MLSQYLGGIAACVLGVSMPMLCENLLKLQLCRGEKNCNFLIFQKYKLKKNRLECLLSKMGNFEGGGGVIVLSGHFRASKNDLGSEYIRINQFSNVYIAL